MANEGTLSASMSIRVTDDDGNIQLEYRNTPTAFRFDVAGAVGPAPGAFLVSTAGVTIDLTDFTTPGAAVFYNLGDSYPYDVGIWDADNSKFFPLFVVAVHTFWPIYLSSRLYEEYGTGTGTTGAATNRLRAKAVGGSTYARVDAFEV